MGGMEVMARSVLWIEIGVVEWGELIVCRCDMSGGIGDGVGDYAYWTSTFLGGSDSRL
jgi:hypothetical protein